MPSTVPESVRGTFPARIHVVAGVLFNDVGHILIAKRAAGAHQGGLWEFPGGKMEPGEGRLAALERELHEELGIRVTAARPLISVSHDNHDRAVLLDVWEVTSWSGAASGQEGQVIDWVSNAELLRREFPAADQPVLEALSKRR